MHMPMVVAPPDASPGNVVYVPMVPLNAVAKAEDNEGQDNKEEGREPSVTKSMIDANDFDDRERCRRHPASSRGRRSCSGGGEGPQVQPPSLRGRNLEDENGGGG